MSLIYKVVEIGPEEEKQRVRDAEALYGTFDLDFWTARPTPEWEIRNLADIGLNLYSYFFPDFFHRNVKVNRRARIALISAYDEIRKVFSTDELHAHHLDQFVRCYAFGHASPSLFWWGAAWELAPKLKGDALDWAAEIFIKNGWKRASPKVFEYW